MLLAPQLNHVCLPHPGYTTVEHGYKDLFDPGTVNSYYFIANISICSRFLEASKTMEL